MGQEVSRAAITVARRISSGTETEDGVGACVVGSYKGGRRGSSTSQCISVVDVLSSSQSPNSQKL